MQPSSEPERYTHGHHQAIVSSHARRTAANSAAFLLGHLQPGMRLLDIGCGPGSITVDLAAVVAPGQVNGIDREPEVLDQARAFAAARGLANTTFDPADVYALPFEADTFDVVYAHQVFQHLARPLAGLAEAKRVLRPGGLLAVRDSDYGTMVHAPAEPGLDRWLELYHQVTRANGADADAGRHLKGWVEQAGFDDVVASASAWCYSDDEARRTWSELWAVRITESAFADQAVAARLADADELAALAAAWRSWATRPGGFFAFIHGEVLARKPGDGTGT
ncbi:MAG: methyltransferase domain-containing protein [Acidimicrobiia bacterium]|nr:methyltransferase domain-containing protein [Acidimicrobiia bacterium]